jgi:hypothetical protein
MLSTDAPRHQQLPLWGDGWLTKTRVAQPHCTKHKGKTMTSNHTATRRPRMTAAAVLLSAAASVASLFGATQPANAAPDEYVALSVGTANETPPVQTIGGMAIEPDADTARAQSLAFCQSSGGGQCVFEISAQHTCVAAASNDYGEIATGQDPTLAIAQQNAKDKLSAGIAGAHIVASGCSNGQSSVPVPTPAAPPAQSAPAAPTLGPTVSFNPIRRGLEADIVDHSGVSSQCTYVMDDVNRNFALAANSTYDLKIVPLTPKFRNRNVTISCDNGTKTQATTRF